METVNANERSYEEEIADVSPLNVIPPASPASTSSAVENEALPKPNASQKITESAAKCRHAQSERENSKTKYVVTDTRSRLSSKTVQAPMCLKSWNLILSGVKPETILID